MDVLNKIIKQNYDVDLSDKNIVDIITYYKMLDGFIEKARFTRTMMESMNNQIIDPDRFLIASIMQYTTPDDMVLIALALRYGAESKYVTYKNVGNVHIMVFTVMELMGKNNVSNFEIETILCIMSLLNVSPAARAFTMPNNNDITTAEWLEQNGFFNFLDPMQFLNMITDKDFNIRISIGTMCDIPEVAFPVGYDETIITEYFDDSGFLTSEKKVTVPQPALPELILNNSFNCADKASIQATFSTGELGEIKMCIDTGALEIFEILIDRGFNFSYFSVNRLLAALAGTIKQDKTGIVSNDKIFSLIYMNMMKYIISRGVNIDKYQFSMLNNFSTVYSKEIEELYSAPLWQKSCAGSDKVPLPAVVNALAAELNIDAEKDKPEICSELRNLASLDFSKLSDMEFERQREKLKLSLPLKERLEKKPKVSCKNAAEIDPLRYTDNTLAFYTDKNNNNWCFTASDFEELVRNPVNPITNEELPPKIVHHIMSKLTMFKNTGINPSLLKPYGQALKDLYKKDTITNIKTSEVVNTIINLGTTRGILETRFRSIPYTKMIYILDYIKMSQDYLQVLPNDFQFVVFCKILLLYFKKNPETLDDILEIIKY
jgi:hypothetical protein